MYEIFAKLLLENNVTAYQVGKATGISTSTLSEWKNGKSKPKIDKLQKIADFFNVPVDYLLTGEKKSPDTEMSEDDEIMEYLNELKNNPGMRMLFSKTKGASREDIEKVVKMLEIMRGDINDGGYYF